MGVFIIFNHVNRHLSQWTNFEDIWPSLFRFSLGLIFFLMVKWVCLKMSCTPLYPMVLLIIIPTKWLFHWGYTLFSDKPKSQFCIGNDQPTRLYSQHPPAPTSTHQHPRPRPAFRTGRFVQDLQPAKKERKRRWGDVFNQHKGEPEQQQQQQQQKKTPAAATMNL